MTTLTDALELNDVLAEAEVRAYVMHGRRAVSFTVSEPGVLHGNRYAWAWFTVSEDRLWAGDMLRMWGERRPEADGQRVPFTDLAMTAVRAETLPRIAAYGFDRWWSELHQRTVNPDRALDQAEQARRAAAWWEHKATLDDLYRMGQVDIVPLPHDHTRREPRQTCAAPHAPYGTETVAVTAKAVVNGEHVGWVTDDGTLIPDQSLLVTGGIR